MSIFLTSVAVFFGIFIVLILIGSMSKSKLSTKKIPAKPKIKMLNRDGDPKEDEWHTYIAGISHYASKYDEGGFSGYVMNDPTNKYDPEAMGIFNTFKLLGYIPAKELGEYREWSGHQPLPCIGFIFEEEGQKRGRVKVLRPCNKEFIEKEFTRYAQWIFDNYGEKYVPKGITFDVE